MPSRRSPKARRRRARTSLSLSDEWRVWVVDNLLADVAPGEIVDALVASQVPEGIARAEVEAILRSPSLVACRHLHARNQRLHQVARLHRALASDTIERRERIPSDQFFRHYFAANRPVIITGYVPTWPAFGKWTPAHFQAAFANVEVEIVAGRARDPGGDKNFQKYRQTATMGQYVERVMHAGESDDLYMIARNKNMARAGLAPLIDDVSFDTELFDPDHLEDALTLWFGPAGTVTPLHHDSTNILFCQIHGRKRIHLIGPWETALLDNADGFYSAHNLEDPEAMAHLRAAGVVIHEVELAPGEALFIPAGWWHHVKALDISITFSLLNFRRANDYSFYRPGSVTP